ANPLGVRRLLTRYTCLLRHPVYCPLDASLVSEGAIGEAVNTEPPPWRDDRSLNPLRQRKLALEFAGRFEAEFEPLCTIPIGDPKAESSDTEAPTRGLLWLQDSSTYGSSDNRRVWVFVRGMMISDDARAV